MQHRPWSFSSLTLYENCPHQYRLRYIDRLPLPPKDETDASERGNRVHKDLEAFLRSERELPEEAAKLANSYIALKDQDLTIEQEWGFDVDWKPLPSWNHPDISCRMKLDVFYKTGNSCTVVDHKTGKRHDIAHAQQGQLYSIGSASRFEELDEFNVRFLYVDQGAESKLRYKRSMIERFKTTFDRRVAKLWNDTQFKPITNKWNCAYCPFGPNGTAACEYRTEA